MGKMGRSGKTGSKYKPEYCELAYQVLAAGKSHFELCRDLKVSESTYYYWMDLHPEFKEAVDRGEQSGLAYWISYGRENMASPEFNETAYNNYVSRVYGITKNRRPRVDLRANNLMQSFHKLLDNIAEGRINTKETNELSRVLIDGASLKDHVELEDKVRSLEERLGEKE